MNVFIFSHKLFRIQCCFVLLNYISAEKTTGLIRSDNMVGRISYLDTVLELNAGEMTNVEEFKQLRRFFRKKAIEAIENGEDAEMANFYQDTLDMVAMSGPDSIYKEHFRLTEILISDAHLTTVPEADVVRAERRRNILDVFLKTTSEFRLNIPQSGLDDVEVTEQLKRRAMEMMLQKNAEDEDRRIKDRHQHDEM